MINLEFGSQPLTHSRKVLVCDGMACTTESTSANIMEIPHDFQGENEDDGNGDDDDDDVDDDYYDCDDDNDDDDDDDSLTLLSFWEHIWRFPTIFLTRSWQNALRGEEESAGSSGTLLCHISFTWVVTYRFHLVGRLTRVIEEFSE